MKFNEEALEKDIDALEGICEDGKKGIKALFTNHFGVEFTVKKKFDLSELKLKNGIFCSNITYGEGRANNLITIYEDGTYDVNQYVNKEIPIQRDNTSIKKR